MVEKSSLVPQPQSGTRRATRSAKPSQTKPPHEQYSCRAQLRNQIQPCEIRSSDRLQLNSGPRAGRAIRAEGGPKPGRGVPFIPPVARAAGRAPRRGSRHQFRRRQRTAPRAWSVATGLPGWPGRPMPAPTHGPPGSARAQRGGPGRQLLVSRRRTGAGGRRSPPLSGAAGSPGVATSRGRSVEGR